MLDVMSQKAGCHRPETQLGISCMSLASRLASMNGENCRMRWPLRALRGSEVSMLVTLS